MLQGETVSLSIAGLCMDVDCGAAVAGLPNLLPFVVCGTGRPGGLLCHVLTGRRLGDDADEPLHTAVKDGRRMRMWLKPDRWRVELTFGMGGPLFRMEADRRWRRVETDWTPGGPCAAVALNDIIMIAFIYSAAFRSVALVHASCVVVGGSGCAFIGPSGIGKSTHSQLWLSHVAGARLLNDDQPAFRLMPDGTVMVFGTPWSGKTPCYLNEGARLRTLFFMEQAAANEAVRLGGIDVFRRLLEATSLTAHDALSFSAISDTQAAVASAVPAYLLRNRPDEDAVRLSHGLFEGGRRREAGVQILPQESGVQELQEFRQ